MKYDKFADAYVKLRDRIAELDRRHKENIAPLKEAMERIENAILSALNDSGAQNVKTPFGTFYRYHSDSVTTSDKMAFLDWVKTNEAWHVLDVRPLKSSVVDMVEQDQSPPPGINFQRRLEVGFRKS